MRTAAEELYKSPLFDGLSYYARTRTSEWFILSAKYGLIEPRTVIEPYELTLLNQHSDERRAWAEGVYSVLERHLSAGDRVVFLAGEAYREFLDARLQRSGILTTAPLSSMGIGKQVAWLKRLSTERIRVAHLDRLYASLRRLGEGMGGLRRLGECTARTIWPQKGVYFFFENSELRTLDPFQLRVVRVGTHAVSAGSVSSIWGRLRTHRGGVDGSGNHRGSIFRLHVGNALLNRACLRAAFPTWGIGQSAPAEIRAEEAPVELEVSHAIGSMQVLFINVADEAGPASDRSYLERNLVAMLAGPTGPLDVPSGTWLGNESVHDAVRTSGLWNVNYVRDTYDPEVLDVLDQYVEVTLGNIAPPARSLARSQWWTRVPQLTTQLKQASLL